MYNIVHYILYLILFHMYDIIYITILLKYFIFSVSLLTYYFKHMYHTLKFSNIILAYIILLYLNIKIQ